MKYSVFILMMLFVFIGCQTVVSVEKPKDVIPRDSMELILMDVALVNASRSFNVGMLKQIQVSPDCYVFEKYLMDSTRYAKSTAYYAADSEDYKLMYLNIQKRLDSILKIKNEEQSAVKKRIDSIRKENALAKKRKDSLKRLKGDTIPRGRRSVPANLTEM